MNVLLSGPNSLELLSVLLSSPCSSNKHCITLLYHPPSAPVSELCTALQILNPTVYTNFLLIGDFNIDFCNQSHPYFSRLQSIFLPFSLSQVVDTHTHLNVTGSATLIDLAFISNTKQLLKCSVIPPLANSDHNGLNLLLKWKITNQAAPAPPRKIWNYKDADFQKARQMLNETN